MGRFLSIFISHSEAVGDRGGQPMSVGGNHGSQAGSARVPRGSGLNRLRTGDHRGGVGTVQTNIRDPRHAGPACTGAVQEPESAVVDTEIPVKPHVAGLDGDLERHAHAVAPGDILAVTLRHGFVLNASGQECGSVGDDLGVADLPAEVAPKTVLDAVSTRDADLGREIESEA